MTAQYEQKKALILDCAPETAVSAVILGHVGVGVLGRQVLSCPDRSPHSVARNTSAHDAFGEADTLLSRVAPES